MPASNSLVNDGFVSENRQVERLVYTERVCVDDAMNERRLSGLGLDCPNGCFVRGMRH